VPFNVEQFEAKSNRAMPRTRVRLDKLVATQHGLDKSKVADIASKPASGPEPLVHPHRGRYYVADGHHRVAGAIERGDSHIWVRRVK